MKGTGHIDIITDGDDYIVDADKFNKEVGIMVQHEDFEFDFYDELKEFQRDLINTKSLNKCKRIRELVLQRIDLFMAIGDNDLLERFKILLDRIELKISHFDKKHKPINKEPDMAAITGFVNPQFMNNIHGYLERLAKRYDLNKQVDFGIYCLNVDKGGYLNCKSFAQLTKVLADYWGKPRLTDTRPSKYKRAEEKRRQHFII